MKETEKERDKADEKAKEAIKETRNNNDCEEKTVKTEKTEKINIMYCGDSNIALGVVMSILSIVDVMADAFDFIILTASLEACGKVYMPFDQRIAGALDSAVKKKNLNSSVTLRDVTDVFTAEPPTANLATRFTPCCMLRLYADMAQGMPQRILYLDSDVICRRDFSDFYSRDMQGTELCGVLDRYGKWFFKKNPKNPLSLFKFDYLNSGVLLLNMEEISKSGLFEKCRRACRDKEMLLPDQSSLNKLARSKKKCPAKYNEQRKTRGDTVFRHYTTTFRFFPKFKSVTVKPWQPDRMHEILKTDECDLLYEKSLFLINSTDKAE